MRVSFTSCIILVRLSAGSNQGESALSLSTVANEHSVKRVNRLPEPHESLRNLFEANAEIAEDSLFCQKLKSEYELSQMYRASLDKGLWEIIKPRLMDKTAKCQLGLIQAFVYSLFMEGKEMSLEEALVSRQTQINGLESMCDDPKHQEHLSSFFRSLYSWLPEYGSKMVAWTICPILFLPIVLEEVGGLFEMRKSILKLTESMPGPDLWNRFGLPEVFSRYPRREILDIATALVVPGTDSKEYDGIESFCVYQSLVIAGLKMYGFDEGYVRLSEICSLSPATVCDSLKENRLADISVNMGRWTDSPFPRIINLAESVGHENSGCLRFLAPIIAEGISKAILSQEVDSLLEARSNLDGLDKFCDLNMIQYLSGLTSNLGLLFFACNHKPVDTLCSRLATESFFFGTWNDKLVGSRFAQARFIEDIVNSGLVAAVNTAKEESCKKSLIGYIQGIMNIAVISWKVSLADFHTAADKVFFEDEFCLPQQDKLVKLRRNDPSFYRSACPNLPPLESSVLRTLANSIQYKGISSRLDVNRATALSDSLPLLCSVYADSSYPTSVYFNGEVGIDVKGLTRDWFTQVAGIAAGIGTTNPDSPNEIIKDIVGDLFIRRAEAKYIQFSAGADTEYLLFNDNKGPLNDDAREHYYAFGRLMALAFIKREQLGIPLPIFFFAKLLNGAITLKDLSPNEHEWANFAFNFIQHIKALPEGMKLENPYYGYYDEDHAHEEFENVDKDNVEEAISLAASSVLPQFTEEMLTEIRKGFEYFVPLDQIRRYFTPEHFKLLIVGEDNLDVAALKRLAERPPYGGMMGDSYYPKRVSEDVFNWLFDWLKDQPRDIHRRFMRFVTGSSSLSARTIKVTGPDLSTQGLMPLAHTCFNHISLPFYSDLKQLSEKLEEAIQNANYGGVEQ
jgi:hypothetical protein